MFANANMSSSTSAKTKPGRKKSRKPIKKRPEKSGPKNGSTSVPTPPPGGYGRYQGLASIKSRPEEDRSLPVGSHGKNPADFRKYSVHSKHVQLDSDLAWTDARKAAGVLMDSAPPLTADLNAKQKRNNHCRRICIQNDAGDMLQNFLIEP